MSDSLPRAETLARLPVVALVGRPNTGKSTLFNRLTRSRRAVATSTPGVTRDRNIASAAHEGRRFLVVDTGGFESTGREEIDRAVREQGLLAAQEADVVVLVLDGRAGLCPVDEELGERLRAMRKPVFLAVNKIDTPKQEALEGEFYALGMGVPHSISAEHGVNVDALMDDVVASLPERELPVQTELNRTAVAIVGRPNVGKSSLLNRLVGAERAIVAASPGTTRDAVDTVFSRAGKEYLLVDTAGVRRRPKVTEYIERASVVRALRALEDAEIGLLVIDAVEGMTEQDARVSTYAWDRGRALGLLVNKWDAVLPREKNPARVADWIDERFPSFRVVPKLFLSALTGEGVDRVWPLVDRLAAAHRLRVQTATLNQVLGDAVRQQAPPLVKKKRSRFFYGTQTATSPPTFTLFTSAPQYVQPNYERYLVNKLRETFSLEGTPVRLKFRARREPRKDQRR